MAHPLWRELRQAGALAHAGGQALRVGRALAVLGGEAQEAQDAQVVLADALLRIADEAHATGREIRVAAERIEQRAVGAAVEGVDGEVAPACIGLPVVGEGDGGVTAEGLHVRAQGGDLVRASARHDRDRSVRDPGRHRLEAGGFCCADHVLGPGRRGDIDLGDGLADQRVAHGAAHHAGTKAACTKCREHGLGLVRCEPVLCRSALGGGVASTSAPLLENTGLDAPVFHAGRYVGLVGPAALAGGAEIDQRARHQHRASQEQPNQRRLVDDNSRPRCCAASAARRRDTWRKAAGTAGRSR